MRMTALNNIIVKAININTDNTTELFLLLETLTAAVSNTSAIFQTDEVSKVNLQSTVLSFHCFFFIYNILFRHLEITEVLCVYV